MALLVWLPLNGNIKNQGLSNITVTNNGATVNDNGKIGKCYSFATNLYILLTNVPASSLSNCSVCFWIKIAANEGLWLLLSGQGVLYYLLAYRSASYQNGNFYSSANVGTNYKIYIDGVEGTAPIHDGNWHHYCASGINLSSWTLFYINRYLTTTDAYNFAGQVNDFRIYDHALSAKEVKDISKGLILHYPLDKNNITFSLIDNENLFIGSTFNEIDRGTLLVTSSTDWGQYVRFYNGAASNHTFSNGDIAEDTILLNSAANIGVSFVRKATDISLDSSSYYTISCEAKCTKANAQLCIGLSYYNTSNTWIWRGGTNPQTFNAVNTWQYFTLTFKPDADTLYIQYCFTVNVGSSGGTDTFTIRKCKLEKGSIATPWIKSPYDSRNFPDCSGFNNGGVTKGVLSNIDSSPKYEKSTTFINGCYITTNENVKVTDAISVCCWGYMDSWSGYNGRLLSCTQTGGWNFEPDSGKMSFVLGTGTSSNTYKTAIATTTFANLSSGWHHFAGTYDGFNTKIYIDGILEGTNNAYTTKTPIFYNTTNTVFIGAEAETSKIKPAATPYYFTGKMSDVRIYATALSAENIMELYNTSAYICNNNTIKAYEFKEFPYLLVEYIKSTGTLTINLEYYPNPLTEMEIELAFEPNENTGSSGKSNSWFGCRSDGTTANFSTNFGDTAALKNTMFYWMNTTYASGATVCQLLYTYSDLQLKNTWHYQNGKVIYLNATRNVTAKTTTNLKPLHFFGYDTTPFNRYNLKLYSLKIKENNTLVRDFIPVRVGNVGYLYDKISNKLFEGTNDFVLGQDVEDMYQDVNIYKNGLIECDEFTENTGLTTFGDSYVLSEEFIEI